MLQRTWSLCTRCLDKTSSSPQRDKYASLHGNKRAMYIHGGRLAYRMHQKNRDKMLYWGPVPDGMMYRQGDSDVISMPAGLCRHLVGITFRMFFTVISLKYAILASYGDHTDIFINQWTKCCLNSTINLRRLTPHVMPWHTHKMAIVSWP